MAPFFARSLTLVRHYLLLNRTETLATQAMTCPLYNSALAFSLVASRTNNMKQKKLFPGAKPGFFQRYAQFSVRYLLSALLCAQILIERERRLGTRQGQHHNQTKITRKLLALCFLKIFGRHTPHKKNKIFSLKPA